MLSEMQDGLLTRINLGSHSGSDIYYLYVLTCLCLNFLIYKLRVYHHSNYFLWLYLGLDEM